MSELKIQSADTTLFAVDSGGSEPSLLFVNGGFATLSSWDPVLRLLGGKYRTVRFDGRARGKSGKSADYSVSGAVDDIGRVIEEAGLNRPILVGWSYGATTALRYTTTHPEKVRGLVLLDGAYPIQNFADAAGQQRVRTQFRRLALPMKLAALLGKSARMSALAAAEALLDMDAVNGTLDADYAALPCPTDLVLATGGHSGTTHEEMEGLRARVREQLEGRDNLAIFATVPVNHVQIVSKGTQTVVDAIEDVVARTAG